MALKHIGNAGSHKNKLSLDNLSSAYEMLEHVLSKLYDANYYRLKKNMQEINKKKRPL